MFLLHEKTQRTTCRWLFLLGCLLPSALVVLSIVQALLPWHRWEVERELSARLGLAVQLQSVAYPRPGLTRLAGLTLADPETGVLLGRAQQVEISGSRRAPVVEAVGLQLAADQLDRLQTAFHRQVMERPEILLRSARLVAGEIELLTGFASDHQTLAASLDDVDAQLANFPAGPQAVLNFRLRGLAMSEPAQLLLTRNRRVSPAITQLELRTGDTPLPCRLWQTQLPWLAGLGENCGFRGEVLATQSAGAWSGQLAGRFSQVDLDRLISSQFPEQLSGSAEVLIRQGRFERGRLLEAAGSVAAGPGVISRGLLDAAIDSLRLARLAAGNAPGGAALGYQRLACDFAISSQGLVLHGQCEQAPLGTLLVDHYGGAVTESAVQPQPTMALVRALSPASPTYIPLSRQTLPLLATLPLPETAPPTILPTAHRPPLPERQ